MRDSSGSADEVGVVSWTSARHVVLVVRGRELRPPFKEGDNSEDLPLGAIRDGVPKCRRVGLSGEGASVHLHGPRELEAVGVGDVSDESKHGNAAVLDLRVAEETDGSLIGHAPELSLGEVERIVEANDGVQLLSEVLEVSLKHKSTCLA